MAYDNTIQRSGNCDQDLAMVLNDIKAAGLGCDVLQAFVINPGTVILTYDDARCTLSQNMAADVAGENSNR